MINAPDFGRRRLICVELRRLGRREDGVLRGRLSTVEDLAHEYLRCSNSLGASISSGSMWYSQSRTLGSDVGGVFAAGALDPDYRGRGQVFGLAPNADMFPGTHSRQAVLEHSAPKALRLGDLLASGALGWVTTAVAAILIAVSVLHRHFRSRHLRCRVRFELLPTVSFDPSPRAVRIRFGTDAEFGKMVMGVEGRESVTGVLTKLTYPDVEIRRVRGEVTVGDEGALSSSPTESTE
jgi:hypothetical protein